MEVIVNGVRIRIPLEVEATGGAAIDAYITAQLAASAAPAAATPKKGGK